MRTVGVILRWFLILVVIALIVWAAWAIGKNANASPSLGEEETPTSESIPSEAPAEEDAPDFVLDEPTGFALTKHINLDMPVLLDFRDGVIENGDRNNAAIVFDRDYPSVVLLRAVPDDLFLEVVFHRADGSTIDLRALLEVQPMDITFFGSATPEMTETLKARGVDVINGEILSQNLYAVDLGEVTKGEWIEILLADDVELGVNNGSLFVFGDAGDSLTKPIK